MAIVKALAGCSFYTRSACLAADRPVRPHVLRWRAVSLLLLLGGLLTVLAPIPAEAEFAYTQITSSTGSTDAGGTNGFPSINSDGTRITFHSDRNLTPGSPGNADGNIEIFLYTQGSGITQITNSTTGENIYPSINSDGTRIAFTSSSNLTGLNADGNPEIFLASGSSVDLQASGSGSGPTLINPVTVTYSVQGCSGKEMYLALNAPAMGIAWSYLSATGWVLLPADLATITPFGSGPVDGTYSLFSGTAPTGTYELYLGCDFVTDGHLNIDTSSGLNLNGVYDYLSATVQ